MESFDKPGTTIFTDARIVLPDRLLRGWLLIDGDRITAVGAGEAPVRSAKVIDLGGRYLSRGRRCGRLFGIG